MCSTTVLCAIDYVLLIAKWECRLKCSDDMKGIWKLLEEKKYFCTREYVNTLKVGLHKLEI